MEELIGAAPDAIASICDEVIDITTLTSGSTIPPDLLSHICKRRSHHSEISGSGIASAQSISQPSPAEIEKVVDSTMTTSLDIWADWLEASKVDTSKQAEAYDRTVEEELAFMQSTGRTRVMKRRQASAGSKTLNEDVAWREVGVILTHGFDVVTRAFSYMYIL